MSDVPPNSELGGYRIERLLGWGGMSVVYLAEHVRLKRKVALKVLSPELAKDERFRERFIRESELAASLEDPNVLPIYEAGEQDGVLFIAMRYLDGTDLKTLLEQEGPLEPARVASIVGQVASALDAAHAKGLVHRDVKPGNILVTRTASSPPAELAFLVDFGLTKRATSDSGLTGTGVFAGTLSYAAPEQFEGGPLDGRTDVYSLGCVLFECLTGLPPFRKEQDAALMHAHLHEQPPSATALRSDLPPAIDRIVAKAMAKRPDQLPEGRRPRGRPSRRRDRRATAGPTIAAQQEGARTARGRRSPRPAGGGDRGRVTHTRRRSRRAVSIGELVRVGCRVGGSTATGLAREHGSRERRRRAHGPRHARAPGHTPGGSVHRRGRGGVWLYSFDPLGGASVLHIDQATGAVRARIPIIVTFGTGSGLAVGSRTVWLIGETETRVSRINPATDEPIVPVSIRSGVVTDIVLGGGALWVGSSDGTLTEFDPLTGLRLGEIALEATPDELAFGEGSVWALDQLGNQVIQVDPEGGRIVARIDVNGSLEDIAAGDGGVWVLDDLAGTVTQIDPQTGTVHDPIGVGPAPSAIAVGLGSAWITDAEDGMIYRVDPGLGSQEPIDVGAPLIAIAIDEATGTLWVGVLDQE